MPRPVIHPGEILADELAEIGITPTEFARQIRVPANRISQIVNGKRAITGDTALRLGHWFGNEPAVLAQPAEWLRSAPRRGRAGLGACRSSDPRDRRGGVAPPALTPAR